MVDNNQGDIELVRLACEEAGVALELATARDGIDGRDELARIAFGESPPCRLLLLDLNMPRLDGRELLVWVRQHPAFRTLPIVILTSTDAPRDRDECLRLGADEFCVKPSDFHQYLALARRLGERLRN
jgi:CheY-like chemotaxis protein